MLTHIDDRVGEAGDASGARTAARGAGERAFAAETIAAAAPQVPTDEAAEIVASEYGIASLARRLVGERDQNFRISPVDGPDYALKLMHPGEDRDVTNFQTSILLHIARVDPSLPVQRVVPGLDGSSEKEVALRDGTRRMMRLTTFLPGTIVRGLPPSEGRSRALGRALAGLQGALADFSHPADAHEIPWDIRHTLQQRAVLPEIADAGRRAMMAEGLARFEERVLPEVDRLRAQVVHNDLSGDNIVVDPADHDRIAGVLDFGDAARTPAINDVAVALAYALQDGDEPLRGALPLLAGFNAAKAVLPEELDLLLDLVISRMVVRVGITEWRARRFPENREYILRSTPTTWRHLEALLRVRPERARSDFQRACETE